MELQPCSDLVLLDMGLASRHTAPIETASIGNTFHDLPRMVNRELHAAGGVYTSAFFALFLIEVQNTRPMTVTSSSVAGNAHHTP